MAKNQTYDINMKDGSVTHVEVPRRRFRTEDDNLYIFDARTSSTYQYVRNRGYLNVSICY